MANNWIASIIIISEDMSKIEYSNNTIFGSMEDAVNHLKNFDINGIGEVIFSNEAFSQIHYLVKKTDKNSNVEKKHVYLRYDIVSIPKKAEEESSNGITLGTLMTMARHGILEEDRLDYFVEIGRISKNDAKDIKTINILYKSYPGNITTP